MSLTDWMSLLACMGHLALALVVAFRGNGSPLRFPLVVICLSLFVWSFAQWAYRATGDPLWDWLEVTSSPLHPPLMFWFATVFVGRFRELKPLVIATFAAFGAMVLCSAARLVVPDFIRFLRRDEWWSYAYLVGLIVAVTATLVLLVRHLRRAGTFEERLSTRLFIVAVLVGNLLGATELWYDGRADQSRLFPIGGLGVEGTLVATILLATVVLRLRLFPRPASALLPLYALTVGGLGVLGYLLVFSLVGADTALLVFGTTTVTLVLAVAARDLFATVGTAREQTRYLATLGRFSAQLAHDVRNPLSALKGAQQFLLEELDQGRSIDNRREFVELSMQQVERIDALVDKYQRLGAVSPASVAIDLNELVSSVWAGVQSGRKVDAVDLRLELAERLPHVHADADLVGVAVQNVIVNALDAMPDGGALTIATQPQPNGRVTIVVTDEGVGMDPRDQERAFDDFHTTKASGSGLGLGFVRRVLEAHGGHVSLQSRRGAGTSVRLILPIGSSH